MVNSQIKKAYKQNTPRSFEAYNKAKAFLPGGNTRQASYWPPYPLTISHGEGAHIWDIDGRCYIDLINNYTSLVHGHSYPPVASAIQKQVSKGTCWSAGSEHQVLLAEHIIERVPSIDKVRFTNSGSEAGNLALTIARNLTGRDKILMARFGYHGSLLEFESGHTNHPWLMTTVGNFNDAESFTSILNEQGEEIAAVFLEPMLGAGGVIPANKEFLDTVMQATREAGAIFVLDEVQTLRMAKGGMQTQLGIHPDLTMLGKVIGGGFPVGAVGGSDEIMSIFDADNPKTFHSGTFNGNPISMIAGDITIRELTDERIDHMQNMAMQIKTGLVEAADKAGLTLQINQVGSIMNLYFTDDDPSPSEHRLNQGSMELFHLAAMNHGLFVAPRGLMVLSTVMTESLIDEAIDRAAQAMQDVAKEVSKTG